MENLENNVVTEEVQAQETKTEEQVKMFQIQMELYILSLKIQKKTIKTLQNTKINL